jgi:subtilisin family serine protease
VLTAPAVDIVSTGVNGTYQIGTGTSSATAIVAGAAALVRAKYPALSAKEVYRRLTLTADDKGAPGRDIEYGFGVLNIVKALTADIPPLPASPPSTTAAPSEPRFPTRTVLIGALVLVLLAAGATITVIAIRRRQVG